MGMRGPPKKPTTAKILKMNAKSRSVARKARPSAKGPDEGASSVMRYPPVPIPPAAAAWYGRLVRRRSKNDRLPLLEVAALRRADSLPVMIIALTLADLDEAFTLPKARFVAQQLEKFGCSPAARGFDAKGVGGENEFDMF